MISSFSELKAKSKSKDSEQDKIQEELQQTQDEIDSTQSKYQSLLDVAKKQLDDDKGTNYYSGKTIYVNFIGLVEVMLEKLDDEDIARGKAPTYNYSMEDILNRIHVWEEV